MPLSELLIIRDGGIDEGHLCTRLRRQIGCECVQNILTLGGLRARGLMRGLCRHRGVGLLLRNLFRRHFRRCGRRRRVEH